MHEIQGLLAQHGLLLIFSNVLLAQLGLPLPAMPMLLSAGAFAARGEMRFASILGVTVLASLLGDIPWYFLGRHYGCRVLRLLGRIAIEPDTCFKQTETIFERWGAPALIVAKYIPGFATVAPPLAGAMRLAFPRFAAYSALGALLWAIAPLAGWCTAQCAGRAGAGLGGARRIARTAGRGAHYCGIYFTETG